METSSTSKREYWRRHVDKSNRHEAGVSSYCRENNLNIAVMSYWRKKFRRESDGRGARSLSPFVRAEVEGVMSRDLPDAKWLATFAAEMIRGLR